jgi:succinyl-CoA synthetase beta subunit
MIVSEDLAKQLLTTYGLPVPPGRAADTPDAATSIAQILGGSAFVVKALIPMGGRGKAGGVKVCASIESVTEAAQILLGHDLLGYRVSKVLVEKALPIAREIYAGVVAN